jgi:hypothetical protein
MQVLLLFGLILFIFLFNFNDILCEGAGPCTDLVVWGDHLSSNVGTGRITRLVSSMYTLPPHIKSIIVGLILSDG